MSLRKMCKTAVPVAATMWRGSSAAGQPPPIMGLANGDVQQTVSSERLRFVRCHFYPISFFLNCCHSLVNHLCSFQQGRERVKER
uniref:Putative secreted protein n=1 Tax=Anopheles marajoara TaxID=58244 RepID=A0A2M4CAV4_9DIPT